MKKNSLVDYFNLLAAMTEKEIKARYKKTIFGFLWVILNPLLQMIVISFVFSFFIRLPVDNYYLFLFSGLLPWQFFSLSLSKSTTSFVFERDLLQKSNFPKEIIPLSIILSNFFHFLISIALLILFIIFFGNLFFERIFIILPASLILLISTIGFSLITSTMQVKFRDINFFVQSILVLWFYSTPILYSLDLIPEKYRFLYFFNPLTFLFELFHFSVFEQSLPSSDLILINFIASIAVLLFGIILFKKEQKYFVDWL